MNIDKLFLRWIAVFGMVMVFAVSGWGAGDGLTATYYNNTSLSGAPVLTRTDATVNFDWGNGSPNGSVNSDNFSARWVGYVYIPTTGTWTFYTNSDDGVRLSINGSQLVNNWTNHAPTENSGTLTLSQGYYPITMEYYENGGGAVAQLRWSGPGISKTIIAQTYLYTSISSVSISITPTSLTTIEEATNATYTVNLSGTSTNTVYVNYSTANGTATSGSDYTATSGTLTFTPGQTSKTINVPILEDTVVESSETYTLTLSNPVNAFLSANYSATGTITNDDTAGTFGCANPSLFNIAYTSNQKGNIKLIGNTNICQVNGSGQCIDPGNTPNNKIDAHNKDGDTIATTENSSSAKLELPNGAKILWAGLYWQGYYGNTPDNATKEAAKSVKLGYSSDNVNKNISYTATTADEFNWVYFNQNRWYYQGFTDITDYVKTRGAGWYWGADVKMQLGTPEGGTLGAWSIAVAYEDTSDTIKNLTIYKGYLALAGDADVNSALSYANANGCGTFTGVQKETDIQLTGFLTPKVGSVKSRFIFFGGEGDISLTGDGLSVSDKDGIAHPLSDGSNPETNLVNSSITDYGTHRDSSLLYPRYGSNTIGIDIDTYDISSIIGHEQTETNIRMYTSGDGYFPGGFGLSTELYEPQLCYDYSIKQNGKYMDINRTLYPIARIEGLVDKSPIDVLVYLKNKEADFPIEGMSLHSDVNTGLFNQTGDISTSNVNGSLLIGRGVTSPIPAYDPDDDAANSLSHTGYTDGHNIRKGMWKLDSEDYVYMKFSLLPQTNGFQNMSESLGLKLDYYISKNGVKIPYYNEQLGGSNIGLCPVTNFYEPVWGQFNVIENGKTSNNINTHVARQPMEMDVTFYELDPVSGKYLNMPSSTMNTTVLVEIIDNDAFSNDNNASCGNPDNNISEAIFVPMSVAPSINTIPIPPQESSYFDFAIKNASYRVWYFTDNNNTLIQNWTANLSNTNNLISNLTSINGLFNPNWHGVCNSTCTANPATPDCFKCIKHNYAKPLCSRDNFSIRPEAFDIRINDINQKTGVKMAKLSEINNYIPTNLTLPTKALTLAGEYKYGFDINATGFDTNESALIATAGYTQHFNGANPDRNITLVWSPDVNATNCNDVISNALSFFMLNGQVVDQNSSHNNVGKYVLNMIDKSWTAVDQVVSNSYRTTANGFEQITDCILNSHSTVPENTTNRIGCDVSSNHIKYNDSGAVALRYRDQNLTFNPYRFKLSGAYAASPNAYGIGLNNTPINSLNSNHFLYMADVSLPSDQNMSLRITRDIDAVGYGTNGLDGNLMSNFVQNCYAKDLNISTAFKNKVGNIDLNLSNYQVNLIEINATNLAQINKYTRELNGTQNVAGIPVVNIDRNDFQRSANGRLSTVLRMNYGRNNALPRNPGIVGFDDYNVSCSSEKDCNVSVNGGVEFAVGSDEADFNITHYYGRAQGVSSRIDTKNDNALGNVRVNFELFMDDNHVNDYRTLPSGRNVTLGEDRNWYKNPDHNQSNFAQYGHADLDGILVPRTTNPDVNVNVGLWNAATTQSGFEGFGATYDGDQGYPHRVILRNIPEGWLNYNMALPGALFNEFSIEFNKMGAWSGESKTDTSSDSNAAINSSRRIMW